MIKKEKLLQMLKKCIDTEENAIPIYTKHIYDTLFMARFNDEERKRVKEILLTLKTDSEQHKRIFLELAEKVKGSKTDVY